MRAGTVALRVVGWTLMGAGVLVGLYLVYSLFFTNLETQAAQERLRQQWEATLADDATETTDAIVLPESSGDPVAVVPTPTPDAGREPVPTPTASATPVPADDPVMAVDRPEAPDGEAVALLWFERPDGPPPVTDEPYVVVGGVTAADLAKGPGHYPQTDDPGGEGNFAVAGHRTTHGAPFFNLDDLQEGDEIHVMDPEGEEYVYRFVDQQIVAPTNMGVLATRPLGGDAPTITLTTCHPRFSNRQRLVVFGELVA